MGEVTKNDDIIGYIEDRENIANKYVMKCFSISILIYVITFVLDLMGIFVVDKQVMSAGFVPSVIIYILMYLGLKRVSLSDPKVKYFLLFAVVLVYTIMGVTITYHVVLVSALPILFATLYSSKGVMRYVYVLTVISTFVIVFGGYYWGLCDANMVLLTTGRLEEYVSDGHFLLTAVNDNPVMTLTLFFVLPRCLAYIAFIFVCNSIRRIVSGSIEMAKLTAELEQAKEEAENANKAKSQFLAKISHEIRTPINAVLGMNEMIIREGRDESIREYAQDVKGSSMLLLSIVNDILDSSKLESGMMEIVPVEYQIRDLLYDVYSMINVKASDKGLKLVFDIDADIPKAYYGDDKRIRQVLLNLLTNAIKYTPEGTVTLKVGCSTEGENAVLHFSVKDTGIGIKPEDIGKIYDAFQRMDVSRNRNVEGTGLGMNIVQQLLHLMGSELQIQSEYEKGSEFSFDLLQKIENAEPLGDFREKDHRAMTEAAQQIGYTAPNAKVLVVDDNAMNIKVFKVLLKETRAQVYEASSGRECLQMLKEKAFDIVFLDHMMPEMDGIETLHAIRENQLCNQTPIIMLTANAAIGGKEMYINEGFTDFLSKPIMLDELHQIMRSYLPKELLITDGLSKIDGFDFDAARNRLQNEELLKVILVEFHDLITPLSRKLSEMVSDIEQEDVVNQYRVEVHAFKSNAATVGAQELSDLAKTLEMAAADKDIEKIKKLHPVLIEEMQKHKERIAKWQKEATRN